jgi:hypothetical protein
LEETKGEACLKIKDESQDDQSMPEILDEPPRQQLNMEIGISHMSVLANHIANSALIVEKNEIKSEEI